MSSFIPNILQCSTIANMLATELKRQNIPVSDNPDDFSNIIYSSAEYILYNYDNATKDISACVDVIKEYINDTVKNHPNYFISGKD